MENESKKDNNDNKWVGYLLIGVFIIWLIAYLKNLFSKTPTTKYYRKSDLVKLYGVDLKTINKWVATFCDQNRLPYDTYKKKRKLPEEMYNYIVECLGEPTEDMPVLSKFQIVTGGEDSSDNEYRGVRNSIRLDSDKIGISPDVYAMFNVFPPKIARLITKKVA